MKDYLINKCRQKENNALGYEQRLVKELHYFEPYLGKLNAYWQLTKLGHLLYPETNKMGSSLVLYLLNLNPVDPLVYDLPFEFEPGQFKYDISFYCNDVVMSYTPKLSLQSLQVLTDLNVVCSYLKIDLVSITKKGVGEVNIIDFIQALLNNNELRSRSYLLKSMFVNGEDHLKACEATTFDELVRYVHDVYIHLFPVKNENAHKYFIVEVYMELLFVGWIWWLSDLRNYRLGSTDEKIVY
jgi:hypothetical protein